MTTPRAVADFDSASVVLGATAAALRGERFPGLGALPDRPLLAGTINAIPRRLRAAIYRWGGWREGMPAAKLGTIRAEEIAAWAVGEYARRPYPAVAIGSASGAVAHLCAALGVPWLPQTVLIPVRREAIDPDDPRRALAAGIGPARALLDANPELSVHHMHDPNHDRLMIPRMAHFRAKRLRLGDTYERFLRDVLAPGRTILLTECERRWPTTQVGERHVFQLGGLGGATDAEYLEGGPRVAAFLRQESSPRTRWEAPPPDGDRPEAEWGFAPELLADATAFARRHGYRLRRLRFVEPDDPSPLVADLYRWWLQRRGLPADRLLVESFVLLDPGWTLRAGAVPFWTLFGVEPSADRLEAYLDRAGPFAHLHLALNSHGVDSIGFAPIDRWRALLRRATAEGTFAGVDKGEYPHDFAIFVRFGRALARLPAPYPVPPPLTLHDVDTFLAEAGIRYPVRLEEVPPIPGRPADMAAVP